MSAKNTREERLAAKLRENLRRRKQQAREIGITPVGVRPGADDTQPALSKRDEDR